MYNFEQLYLRRKNREKYVLAKMGCSKVDP